MRYILERLTQHAAETPNKPALVDDTTTLTYEALRAAVVQASMSLSATRIAVMMDNSCAWAVIDLAIADRGAIAIPVPPFFTDTQIQHLIADADPGLIITDQPERVSMAIGPSAHGQLEVAGRILHIFVRAAATQRPLPPNTCKITYTSGTTGQPKGVCLSGESMVAVTISLSDAVQADSADRSLSLLPLSTLLENIGGIYAPICSGGTAALPSLVSCGFSGSSAVQPDKLIAAFHRYAPTATILVPQLLKLLVECLAAGAVLPTTLRFVAVGGAPCSERLIQRAWKLGLPVHEGYGLSEAASVVSLNHLHQQRAGSVGKPLSHVHIRLADDGEIIVAGQLFVGYLGDDLPPPGEWPTGDLGRIDADGYLHIVGRKKTAFATAFGRNVAPEWVESELTADPAVMQAAVFGEGRACNVAVLVPHPTASREQIDHAVAAANLRLPDYARVHAWCPAEAAFSPRNGLARTTGAPNRQAIERHYANSLETLYATETAHDP
jgi:long-subunit acyl-CoA synthetase (AMP-forming)